MSGIVAQPVGITSPPIDDLLEHVDSKYALVIFAAKRARQINSYNLQLQQNMFSSWVPSSTSSPTRSRWPCLWREINKGHALSRSKPEA